MEFPLLRQWITQIVNEYLKFGNCNFVFAISHVLFTSNAVLRLLRIHWRDLVGCLGQTANDRVQVENFSNDSCPGQLLWTKLTRKYNFF